MDRVRLYDLVSKYIQGAAFFAKLKPQTRARQERWNHSLGPNGGANGEETGGMFLLPGSAFCQGLSPMPFSGTVTPFANVLAGTQTGGQNLWFVAGGCTITHDNEVDG